MSSTKSKAVCVGVLAGLMVLGGCASTGEGPTIQGSHAEGEGVLGAGLGAVVGAVIGHQSGHTAQGAEIGALLGGTVGYLHGRAEDIAQANKLATEARQQGDTVHVETATVQDPHTHKPVQVFKGFHVTLPAHKVARQDPRTLVMLRQCGALAVKVHTDVAASGPPDLHTAVVHALALPADQIQYAPVAHDPDIRVNVVASS